MENILGGLLISLVSGIVGHTIGTHKSVKFPDCDRRQKDCQRLLIEKIDHLSKKIDGLADIVNTKLLGL